MTENRPQHPAICAVVFDLDGLMFNTEDVFNASGIELLRRRDLEFTDAIRVQMMGRRAVEAFEVMKEMTGIDEPTAALLEESESIFKGLLDEHLAPMPGLFELLELIESRGLPKGVATSSSRRYLTDILGRFDLSDRFGMTLTAEDVTLGKPNPEIYEIAASRLEVAPAQMLVLEDSQAGTQAGVAAGATVVSIPHEHSSRHDFANATYIANALNDPVLLAML